MPLDPLAGLPVPPERLPNLARLLADYYTLEPSKPVSFGTSGHRGSASAGSFNEPHVAAIARAVIEYRRGQGFAGPLFLGHDTHALSEAAWRTVLEVLAADPGTETVYSLGREYAPTPVISFMILESNRKDPARRADGVVITPSHNPPQDGGIKYNPPHGGPADVDATGWIERRAAELIGNWRDIPRLTLSKALSAPNVRAMDYIGPFVEGLEKVVDLSAAKSSGLKIGADPLGGSGVHYWEPIAERYGLNLELVNPLVDPSFSFMTVDADGAVRMDCSSPYAMANLIKLGSRFDLGLGNDPDFDRHGIVSGGGLMSPNGYLAVAAEYLLTHRPSWPAGAKVGKTAVSSVLIDRAVAGVGREIFETPVGFKWFVEGLGSGALAFAGEESAGGSFLRFDQKAWTTDKCGFCMTLLAVEMASKTGELPHERLKALVSRYGETQYRRVDTNLTDAAKAALSSLSAESLIGRDFAGRKIKSASAKAPGNGAAIGGLKASLDDGSWFAARPSGTEPKMKLYAESLAGQKDLDRIIEEASLILSGA
ncbi:MAG: phosphoglucomutase, alpha-D-glucose phosphate-specific [Deltaproteobacteria bacterium]|jgi:phosphoglucomutase|nr:phosphoglucomutase, alpha-D-glucose phosphate-specific [Deltaproteobacteria bacterium]